MTIVLVGDLRSLVSIERIVVLIVGDQTSRAGNCANCKRIQVRVLIRACINTESYSYIFVLVRARTCTVHACTWRWTILSNHSTLVESMMTCDTNRNALWERSECGSVVVWPSYGVLQGTKLQRPECSTSFLSTCVVIRNNHACAHMVSRYSISTLVYVISKTCVRLHMI